MNRRLMILEVSRKQDYIFSSRKLKDNVRRSSEIREVTESVFFHDSANGLYCEADNLVYSGGGHTVLQFPDVGSATAFAKAVSTAALCRYPDMELYIKQTDYDSSLLPGDNLRNLTDGLERKKALRRPSFRWLSTGVEALSNESWSPSHDKQRRLTERPMAQLAPLCGKYPLEFEQLVRSDNYIAVVHIDGNAMGARVEELLKDVQDWDDACNRLKRFSSCVDTDYSEAFHETVSQLLHCKPELDKEEFLPIRPIIQAGDDVCFVTAGSIGLECARLFLEALSSKTNTGDGKGYAACAGVALVHYKYPFHMAYRLSEELCSSAKRFGQSLDAEGRVSAIDWHIEFGQLKDGLGEIRKDYFTDDGNRLELRPVTVVMPTDVSPAEGELERNYAYFRALCGSLRGEYGKIARGKLKDLRTALKQGETETLFYLADKQISDLLYHPFDAKHQSDDAYREALRSMFNSKTTDEKKVFTAPDMDGVKRSLFFDALEMIDHFEPLKEVKEP